MTIPEGKNVGDRCDVCGHRYYREQVAPTVFIEGCSEFCDRASDEARADLKDLRSGDYGIWPCSDCGCAVEGDYEINGICSECHRKQRQTHRTDLLRRALPYLPPELAQEVETELGR